MLLKHSRYLPDRGSAATAAARGSDGRGSLPATATVGCSALGAFCVDSSSMESFFVIF